MSHLAIRNLMIVSFFLLTQSFFAQQTKTNSKRYDSYDDYPVYLKGDLGCTYTPKKTTIKLWSPNVEEVKIRLYKQGDGVTATATEHLLYDAATGV